MSQLSKQYYDAVLTGNTELADSLKCKIDELTKSAQKSYKPNIVNNILVDDHTPPMVVYEFLNDKYGEDWWTWEFETIEHMLWKDFGLVLSDNQADRIQAIKTLLNNQRPFLDWYYFNQVAVAFGGAIADFTTIKSPSPGMAIAAMRTMMHIRPEEPFSRDVKKFVCLTLINDGIYCPPPSLFDVLNDEFDDLISAEAKAMWPAIIKKCSEMVDAKEYGESDDPVDVQARRLIVAEHASNKFGG